MTREAAGNESEGARAHRALVELQEQAQEVRARLSRLQREVVEAENLLGSSRAGQLLEANAQLVVSTLRAQTAAATCAAALQEVSRSSGLDALTELPNRALLLDRFAQAIAHAKRHGALLALLFLDLNRFKQVNDRFGHAVGDQALKLVAQCLRSSVRETDTVSRHGGDEFLILLADVSEGSDASLVAEKVIAALGADHRLGEHAVRLTASIGISLYPEDGEEAGMLIDRADAAMYVAKGHERGGFVFYSPEHRRPQEQESREPPGPRASRR